MFVATSSRGVIAAFFVLVVGCGSAEAPPPSTSTAVDPPPPAPAAADAAPPAESAAPSAATPAVDGAFASLTWLVGTWVGKSGDGADVEETWSAPAGMTMAGTGRTTKAGKTTTETLKIESRDGGLLVYVAQPAGAATPTELPLDAKTSGPTHAQFVNEKHDWPTRIRYERVGDELKVRVRGRTGQADEQMTLKKK